MINWYLFCGWALLFLVLIIIFVMLAVISENLSEKQLLFTGVSLVFVVLMTLVSGVMMCKHYDIEESRPDPDRPLTWRDVDALRDMLKEDEMKKLDMKWKYVSDVPIPEDGKARFIAYRSDEVTYVLEKFCNRDLNPEIYDKPERFYAWSDMYVSPPPYRSE